MRGVAFLFGAKKCGRAKHMDICGQLWNCAIVAANKSLHRIMTMPTNTNAQSCVMPAWTILCQEAI